MRFLLGAVALLLLAWFAFLFGMLGRAARRKSELPPLPDPADDTVDIGVALDAVDFRSTASAFRGGTLELQFGGGTIDLRGATLHPAGAELHVDLVFGGASLIVPPDWQVTSHVRGIGGVGDNRTTTAGDDAPQLAITGSVLFGGLGIMSRDPQWEAPATA